MERLLGTSAVCEDSIDGGVAVMEGCGVGEEGVSGVAVGDSGRLLGLADNSAPSVRKHGEEASKDGVRLPILQGGTEVSEAVDTAKEESWGHACRGIVPSQDVIARDMADVRVVVDGLQQDLLWGDVAGGHAAMG
jgi:hypothetical protein